MTVPNPSDHSIATALCDVSRDVLWNHAARWALSKKPDMRLEFRVGSGEATHLKVWPDGRFRLNYGVKMVRSKLSNRALAEWWTSGREILTRGYFSGEITPLNLFAHTAVHEFSHLIQVLNGWRYNGSMHNEDFYRVCGRIHASGKAEEVRDYLERTLGQIHFEAYKPLQSVGQPTLKVGQKVRLDHQGRVLFGVIVRVNKKTYSVHLPDGNVKGRVPFHIATPIEGE